MDKLPEQNSKKPTSLVDIIAVISLAAFLIAEVAIIILVSTKILSWLAWLFFTISGIVELILLFSLSDAIKRITVLENALLGKGIIEKKELECDMANVDCDVESDTNQKIYVNSDSENVKDDSDIDLKAAGVTFCKECNFQLFPEDEFCPYCGAKVKTDNDNE